ncbi:MAG: hypothetical protein JSW52_04170 [Candidatus Coatesbacteria bacterium]|nr:MAG: hypothetical protein JSW52_04170 [Candidatus Coatesbacteria bacterium]
MGKTIYVGLAALAVWGACANAHAASPVVVAEYGLCSPTSHFAADVTTSPDGVAVFQWDIFDTGVRRGAVAVVKSADEPYVAYGVTTAALNRDWSKIALSHELLVSDLRYADTASVDDIEKVAREIGVQREEVIAALYDDGMVGFLLVAQPVIVDLETRVETPLAVAGSDFLYWLNDDELVIGRMSSGVAWGVCCGFMEPIKYDVRTGERETFAFEDLAPLFGERCTEWWAKSSPRPDNLRRPFTSKDWRPLGAEIVWYWQYEEELDEPEELAPPVVVPSRGGQFENDDWAVFWVPAAGGPAVWVTAGNVLAASDDGDWLFVIRFDDIHDPPWPDEFFGLRLEWQ